MNRTLSSSRQSTLAHVGRFTATYLDQEKYGLVGKIAGVESCLSKLLFALVRPILDAAME
jgi:hypothetical protein